MAAAAKTMDARARSLELAEARGETSCSWAARTLDWTLDATTGALARLTVAIHSAQREQVYTLTYDAIRDDARCGCRSAQFGHACRHRGLAIFEGRAVARLYTPAGRAEAARAYRADLAAEGNAAALAPSL